MYHVSHFNEHNIFVDIDNAIRNSFVKNIKDIAMEAFISQWRTEVNSDIGPSGRGRNKLRTYCTFKKDFKTENYCKMILPLRQRSAFAKF